MATRRHTAIVYTTISTQIVPKLASGYSENNFKNLKNNSRMLLQIVARNVSNWNTSMYFQIMKAICPGNFYSARTNRFRFWKWVLFPTTVRSLNVFRCLRDSRVTCRIRIEECIWRRSHSKLLHVVWFLKIKNVRKFYSSRTTPSMVPAIHFIFESCLLNVPYFKRFPPFLHVMSAKTRMTLYLAHARSVSIGLPHK